MGASFRNTGEIISLAGCDRLTIGPSLLEELAASTATIEQRLDAANATNQDAKVGPTESAFRWDMNEDAMATEKLSEGIRNFAIDQVKLEKLLASKA